MRKPLLFIALAALIPLGAGSPAPLLAQHETASDLLDGERAYGTTCVNCHGPNGDVIAGINLLSGQFRRPYTDEELAGVIRNGIPNTGMPPSSMSAEQAAKLVSYMRSSAKAKPAAVMAGDATRGKAVYDGKGGCANCHRVDGVGSRVGPDLSRVAGTRRPAELQTALLDPAADVQPQNRFYRVVLKDGTTVTGRLLSHDTFTVQMIDMKEQLRSFVKAEAREHGFIDTPMPSFKGRLTPQEVADVVAYLQTLKPPPAAPGGPQGAPQQRGR